MISEVYSRLSNDLSGSISKNRFRIELLWGLSKIFDVYDKYDDFCVIFDYVCDVELHYGSGIHFYQVKSKAQSTNTTLKSLLKREKSSSSILGKLCKVQKEKCDKVEIVTSIVSNARLKTGKKVIGDEEIRLSEIEPDQQKIIHAELLKELGFDPKLEHVTYIKAFFDLMDPKSMIKGKIADYFESRGEPLERVNALYGTLYDEISGKACCEFMPDSSYATVVELKGISKSKFDEIISNHIGIPKDTYEKVKSMIDKRYFNDVSKMREMTLALIQMRKNMVSDLYLKRKEEEIKHFIQNNISTFNCSEDELVDRIYERFIDDFMNEYGENSLKVLIMCVWSEVNAWQRR